MLSMIAGMSLQAMGSLQNLTGDTQDEYKFGGSKSIAIGSFGSQDKELAEKAAEEAAELAEAVSYFNAKKLANGNYKFQGKSYTAEQLIMLYDKINIHPKVTGLNPSQHQDKPLSLQQQANALRTSIEKAQQRNIRLALDASDTQGGPAQEAARYGTAEWKQQQADSLSKEVRYLRLLLNKELAVSKFFEDQPESAAL